MKSLKVALAVGALALPVAAAAKPLPDKSTLKPTTPACEMPYERAVTIGRRTIATVQAGEFDDYVGQDAKALVDEINSEPPETAFKADHVLVIELPDTAAVIALFSDGCETTAFRADPEKWKAVKTRVLGQPS